ncbi:MAG: hypothetical protein MJ204_02110 [Bacteroidales bacterium]|nr:hypothetical protein [Bacteroidales bacterium]
MQPTKIRHGIWLIIRLGKVPSAISIRKITVANIQFLPAAGYRNESNLNNAGSNGNYWSSSLNENNPNNAWNVNFNSNNVNRNDNNRNNGQSVRPVLSFQHLLSI